MNFVCSRIDIQTNYDKRTFKENPRRQNVKIIAFNIPVSILLSQHLVCLYSRFCECLHHLLQLPVVLTPTDTTRVKYIGYITIQAKLRTLEVV